jgi:hypothetical protein
MPEGLLCAVAAPGAPDVLILVILIVVVVDRAVLDRLRSIVATSHGGQSRLIAIEGRELSWDLADWLMRLCVDAFGPNGFPLLELAEASGPHSQQCCTRGAVAVAEASRSSRHLPC